MKSVRRVSSMEVTCLQHLDEVENWKILRTHRPAESILLPFRPFFPIFFINLGLFTIVFTLVFVGLEAGFGGGLVALREDAAGGVVFVLLSSILLAVYVMNLYRAVWNRRARLLQSENQVQAV